METVFFAIGLMAVGYILSAFLFKGLMWLLDVR